MLDKTMVRLLLAAALVASAVSSQADVFNLPNGQTSLQFVIVGDPGNVADPATGSLYGSVSYVYQMGKYDVTTAQYCQFLNAVATTSDPYGLYDIAMAVVGDNSYGCGIVQSGAAGSYTYTVTTAYQNFPVNYISWGDAARFCNWLDNGQPSGPEGNGTTETGAYAMNGATTDTQLMAVPSPSHSGIAAATYFLPTENEWYKACYYIGGGTNAGYWTYPTQSNTAPSNALSATGTNNASYYNGGYTDPTNYLTPVGAFADSPGPYGTFDMGGDVWQWNESNNFGVWRGVRGGTFIDNSGSLASADHYYNDPTNGSSYFGIGFRVASSVAVPEPSSIAMLLAGTVALGIWRRRRRA